MNIVVAEDNISFEVELRDLIKPLGFTDHSKVAGKFKRFIGQINAAKSSGSYESMTYIADNKSSQKVNSVRMSQALAVSFIAYCDSDLGLSFVLKMETQLKEQQAQLVLAKDTEIAKLTSDLATAKAKVVYTNTKFNRVSRHKELMDLVSSGILDVSTYQVTHRKYSVTAYGLQLGYSTNDNGTVIQP